MTIAQPQNWRSTYAVMIGTEYKWLALESLPELGSGATSRLYEPAKSNA